MLGRWSWIGHGCKIRIHEGEVRIGAKTVMGQECTISAYQHVSIGRECVIADRVMLIDFDHGVVEVERPIRLQGIYKRDVNVGHNCWIGYGACILRGVTVGDNAIDRHERGGDQGRSPPTRSSAGIPARVIRMREAPHDALVLGAAFRSGAAPGRAHVVASRGVGLGAAALIEATRASCALIGGAEARLPSGRSSSPDPSPRCHQRALDQPRCGAERRQP